MSLYLSMSFMYFLVWMDRIWWAAIIMMSSRKPSWMPPSDIIVPLTSTQKIRDTQKSRKVKLFAISHFSLRNLFQRFLMYIILLFRKPTLAVPYSAVKYFLWFWLCEPDPDSDRFFVGFLVVRPGVTEVSKLYHHQYILMNEYTNIARAAIFMMKNPIDEIMYTFLEKQIPLRSGKSASMSGQLLATLWLMYSTWSLRYVFIPIRVKQVWLFTHPGCVLFGCRIWSLLNFMIVLGSSQYQNHENDMKKHMKMAILSTMFTMRWFWEINIPNVARSFINQSLLLHQTTQNVHDFCPRCDFSHRLLSRWIWIEKFTKCELHKRKN